MSNAIEIPTAEGRVGRKLELGGWRIVVAECPFCKGRHEHMSRETIGALGTREAPCHRGTYKLVVPEEK